jgi:hypothetical protein
MMESLHGRRADDQEENRRKARSAGIKLLIGGLLGAPAYVFASLQTYGHLKTVPAIIAFSVALVCVFLGARALILTRR